MSTNSGDRRQKLREQMKQFYGDPDAAGGGQARKGSEQRHAGVAPEMDLDSEYFSVSKYTTDLLRRESLKGLVEADTELLRRVRRLDGDLQELVYRNYAKFLSANATIKEMQENVQEMGAKLQALSANVDDMDAVSRDINGALQEHRSRVENTISANRLLKKVQFLAALPGLMRRLIDRKEYTPCVKYWVAGDGFLAQHAGVGNVAAIHDECRALARELYSAIEATMCAFPLDDPDSMDTIRRFVENMRLLRATSLFGSAPHESEDTFEDGVLRALMRSVAGSFASGVAAVQRSVRSSLAVPDYGGQPVLQRGQPLEQLSVREALAQLKSACALLAVNSEKVYSLLNQGEMEDRTTIHVAQEVQPVLIATLDLLSRMLADYTAAALDAVVREAGTAALENPQAVKELIEQTAAAAARHLKSVATTLKGLGATYLDTKLGSGSAGYAALVDDAVLHVLRQCAAVFSDRLPALPAQQPLSGSVFMTERERESYGLLAGCVATFLAASLAAALEAAFTRTVVVPEVVLASAAVSEACERLRRAAAALQQRAVILLGQVEARAVERCVLFAGEGAAEAPVAVPALLLGLGAEWASVARVLEAIPPALPLQRSSSKANSTKNSVSRMDDLYSGRSVGNSAAGPGPRHTRLTLAYQRKENADLVSNVNRIFAGAAAVLPVRPRDGRPAVALGCVAVYVLKCLVDTVRQVPQFSQGAFHRLQVCCTYLLRLLLASPRGSPLREWATVWEAEGMAPAMHRLLEEACLCAYERYEAKVPLADKAIDAIVTLALRGPDAAGNPSAAAAAEEEEEKEKEKEKEEPAPQQPQRATAATASVSPPSASASASGGPRDEPIVTVVPTGTPQSTPAQSAAQSRANRSVDNTTGRRTLADEDELPI